MKWIYDVYALKIRRILHSPLRQAESPSDSWRRLEAEMLLPPAPADIRSIFMVEKTVRRLHRYGVEVCGVHFHSDQLRDLISRIGTTASVEVRYDPADAREIAVLDPDTGKHFSVAAKAEGFLAVSFEEAKNLRRASDEAKAKDRKARSLAAQMAAEAQILAESRKPAKRASSLKRARSEERERQRRREILDRTNQTPRSHISDVQTANQPTRKLAVRRGTRLPELEQME
ncbi:Mu transposase C-terminal domain-containing protein [Pontibaca salina]|uniref:Mu transposase C-terminal domain-containing protein n=1 Tax=Pontibaca salina TaxID=2795731 RepID=A0A934HS30_9RHOB|nr:Mu transposase C-terminal domain-containing protein [Pontibaca salina]MBI6630737.1 Mu transposase C-terminal domain-containing protein [Pontibaca salina]